MTPSTTILKETAELFRGIRRDVVAAAKNLYEISSKELWKSEYGSYAEYLEEECQISAGFAAKLGAVWAHYVVEAGMKAADLRAVDTEKLYLAMRLPMKPAQQLVRAETWTRSELKAELASEGGEDCLHVQTITICAKCNKRIV